MFRVIMILQYIAIWFSLAIPNFICNLGECIKKKIVVLFVSSIYVIHVVILHYIFYKKIIKIFFKTLHDIHTIICKYFILNSLVNIYSFYSTANKNWKSD